MTKKEITKALADAVEREAPDATNPSMGYCPSPITAMTSDPVAAPKKRLWLQLAVGAACLAVAALAVVIVAGLNDNGSTVRPLSQPSAQVSTAPTVVPTPVVFDENNADFQTLKNATVFTYRASDAQPDAPETVKAFARLYDLPNAREYFEQLEQTGTTAGKMYALCGLYKCIAPTYDAALHPDLAEVYDPILKVSYVPSPECNPELIVYLDLYKDNQAPLTISPNRYGEDSIADVLNYEAISFHDGELSQCILSFGRGQAFTPKRDPFKLNHEVFVRDPSGSVAYPQNADGSQMELDDAQRAMLNDLWEDMPSVFSDYFRTNKYPGSKLIDSVSMAILPELNAYIAILEVGDANAYDESFVYLYRDGTITPLMVDASRKVRFNTGTDKDGTLFVYDRTRNADGSVTLNYYTFDGQTLTPTDKTFD